MPANPIAVISSVHALLLGLDDDGGIARRGGNGVQKAGLIQTVTRLAILRHPVRRRIAQSRQQRQRQGWRMQRCQRWRMRIQS